MSTYYFVGGPIAGQQHAFLERLVQIGGVPGGWVVFPHATGDGRALHLVEVEKEDDILAHLAQFGPIYEHGPIVEVAAPTVSPAT